MALYDHMEAAHNEAKLKNYEELKASIKPTITRKGKKVEAEPWTDTKFWKEAKMKHHPHTLALEHILGMETKIKEQAEELAKYRDFFATLDSLLPRRPSIHDIIG